MRTEGCKWVSNLSYNEWVEIKWVFTMHTMHDTNCKVQSEVQNVSECECKSMGKWEHRRAKSKNVILRAKDEVRSLEMRSELQQGSESRGVKFYLFFFFFCMYRGVYILYKIFKWKGWQQVNFTTQTMDRRSTHKIQQINIHIWLIMPVVRLRDHHVIAELPCQGNAKAKHWHALTNWYPDVLGDCLLSCKISGVPCGAESLLQWGNDAHKVLKMSAERENDQKWSEKVGKGWQRSEMIGIGHVTSVACGAIMWSSTNGVKMWKYANSELWSSSLAPTASWDLL
jgi:hypothetical protein